MKNVKKKVVATPVNKTTIGEAVAVTAKETSKVENASVVTSEKAAPTASTVKPEPVKATPVKPEPVKTEPVKAEAAKVAPAKKTAEKPAAKKAPAKKAPAKKVEIKENLHIEFSGKSYSEQELMKSVKDIWKYDYKKKAADLKAVELYVKPEEGKAYYVINDEVMGDFII